MSTLPIIENKPPFHLIPRKNRENAGEIQPACIQTNKKLGKDCAVKEQHEVAVEDSAEN